MFQGIENFALAIPAFTALVIQIWLIAHSDKRKLITKNWPISLFFCGVLGLSFLEFSTYLGLISPALSSMKLFYVFCSLAFSGILLLSMKISGIKILQTNLSRNLVITFCVFFSIIMITTDFMIIGIESIGYSITRIPGNYYYITQIYAASLIGLTIFCLTIGSKITEDCSDKKRARVLLYSTTPFLFIFLSLILLMALDVKINASVIVPLATTYMLSVLIITEQQENLFSLLLKIPYTSERLSYKQITSQIEEFLSKTDSGHQASLKSLTLTIEQQIVSMALKMSNGSQIKAASLLNISASSICRKKNH